MKSISSDSVRLSFITVTTSKSMWNLHKRIINVIPFDVIIMQHNDLLVYIVRWKVGWNILPNATCSHQSGTVKFSRHQSPTDCRLHQFPDSYVVKFQVHLFTKPEPSSMLFQNLSVGANPPSQVRAMFGWHASFLKETYFTCSKPISWETRKYQRPQLSPLV